MGTPAGDPNLRKVAFQVAQLGGYASMCFAERVGVLGLTPPQSGLLHAVSAQPGRSQQAVAEELGLLPSRLVALVDELEQRQLLERRRNPSDRRHYALYLTAAGTRCLEDIAELSLEHAESLLEPLGRDQRAMLGELLDSLAAHHGLRPGVHPGYRTLGSTAAGADAACTTGRDRSRRDAAGRQN